MHIFHGPLCIKCLHMLYPWCSAVVTEAFVLLLNLSNEINQHIKVLQTWSVKRYSLYMSFCVRGCTTYFVDKGSVNKWRELCGVLGKACKLFCVMDWANLGSIYWIKMFRHQAVGARIVLQRGRKWGRSEMEMPATSGKLKTLQVISSYSRRCPTVARMDGYAER
jgi:hypothetical protein